MSVSWILPPATGSAIMLSFSWPGGAPAAREQPVLESCGSIRHRHSSLDTAIHRGTTGCPPARPGRRPGSQGPERLGGRHAGGADRGQQPGDGTDDEGGAEAAGPGFWRDDDGPALGGGVAGGGGRAGDVPG